MILRAGAATRSGKVDEMRGDQSCFSLEAATGFSDGRASGESDPAKRCLERSGEPRVGRLFNSQGVLPYNNPKR